MKIYEKQTLPAREHTYCAKTKCDLCGFENLGDDWTSKTYQVNETEVSITIKAKKGEKYPEGGNGVEIEVDLCPMCFTSKLVPWLNSQGADIKEKEWEW